MFVERWQNGTWTASIPQVPGCFIDADSLEDARHRIRRALWITDRDAENAVLRLERVRRNGLANEFLFVETAGGEVSEPRTIQAGEPLACHPSYALSYGLSYMRAP